jgi:hypothetical protein
LRRLLALLYRGEVTVAQIVQEIGASEEEVYGFADDYLRERPYRRVKPYRCKNPRCRQNVAFVPCPICRAAYAVLAARARDPHCKLTLPTFWNLESAT